MSDMKCPICGNDLEHYHTGLVCYRHCLNGKNVWGSEETLKDLDRTRKALQSIYDYTKIVSSELAKNHLGQFQKPISKIGDMAHIALKAEQKD